MTDEADDFGDSEEMEELDDALYEKVESLCEAGNQAQEADRLDEAMRHFEAAWDELPEPKTKWGAAVWILGAIGDVALMQGQLDKAKEALTTALDTPDGRASGFIHMTLGEVYYHQDRPDAAVQSFMGAYMLEGPEIFEDYPPEYLALLKTKADI